MNGDGDPALARRLENVTPAQRAVLEQRLMKRRTGVARRNIISRREVASPCALSHAQELLWLLTQVLDGGVAYNVPGAFRLQGVLDLELLSRALEALVERHSTLRTTYSEIDGRPMQSIGPPHPVELNVVDLRGLPHFDRNLEAQGILREESRFRFDLVSGPMMRAAVIRLADDEHIFTLTLHHIATDGYSRGVLYRDLTELYDALATNAPVSLPPLTIEYADYAVWHRQWLDSGVAEKQLKYWKTKLAAIPSRLDLPTDFPRPPIRSHAGDYRSTMLDIATREGLRTVARRRNATLFVALVSVFAALLGRYAGQDDVVLGTPFIGRNRTELESMVGYFVNPLALRIDLSGDPTFSELLGRTREATLEAFASADVPYARVVGAINPERNLSQTPVFQAMIVLQNPAWQTDRPKFEPSGIRCSEISPPMGWSKFDLLLGASERTTGLNTTWEYSTELFDEATILRMMEHFRAFAERAVNSADRPLSMITMLSDAEHGKLLACGNACSNELSDRESVKQLFEEQVARTPDAAAVVFSDGRQTYSELNRRANSIARCCAVLASVPARSSVC